MRNNSIKNPHLRDMIDIKKRFHDKGAGGIWRDEDPYPIAETLLNYIKYQEREMRRIKKGIKEILYDG